MAYSTYDDHLFLNSIGKLELVVFVEVHHERFTLLLCPDGKVLIADENLCVQTVLLELNDSKVKIDLVVVHGSTTVQIHAVNSIERQTCLVLVHALYYGIGQILRVVRQKDNLELLTQSKQAFESVQSQIQ